MRTKSNFAHQAVCHRQTGISSRRSELAIDLDMGIARGYIALHRLFDRLSVIYKTNKTA